MEPSIDRVVTNTDAVKSISVEQAEINCKNLENKVFSQRAVFHYMVPTVFQSYLANDPNLATSLSEDDLLYRWHTKYSKIFGDYFTELMVNDDVKGKESRDRILAGEPTTEDCLQLKEYLEDPTRISIDEEGNTRGGSFLADENETALLLKEYKKTLN